MTLLAYTFERKFLYSLVIVLGFSSCNQVREPKWRTLSFERPEGMEREIFGDFDSYGETDERAVYRRCPTLSSARVLPQSENFLLVEIKGSGFIGIEKTRARLSTGEVVQVECRLSEGVLRCPAATPDFELFFGFRTEGGVVACTGDGYSLGLKEGEVSFNRR